MMEISLFDNHFGMLAWGPECGGKSQDLKIIERLYSNAVNYMLDSVDPDRDRFEKILFPVGSDFFHVNDTKNVTPQNKNPLDVDSRLAKIFSVGCMAVINAIEECRHVAPTKVVFVPGNHDSETSYFLCKYLEAWYRNCDDVSVDTGPAPRKFIRYGVNLIGLTHGSEEPWRDLPTIMATEVPGQWAETEHREWHVGHQHKRKQTQWLSADTIGSVTVRMLPSLSRLDAWHYKKGYCSQKAAEAYLWSRNNGYVGHLSVPASALE